MNPIYQTNLTGAGMWSKVVSRGKLIRFTDLEGGANVSLQLFNAHERTERYNMPDTLKGQQVFYLTQGICLHSDMGRILASVIEDTMGWHDTVCGVTDEADVFQKHGEKSYQDARNDWYRSGKDCFLIELAKWGLGNESLLPNVNLFSKVVTDEEGDLNYVSGASQAGSSITLRMDMDCLVVLNTCQHPLNPETTYQAKPVKLEVFQGPLELPVDDECRNSHPENERAFTNTEDYHTLRF